MPDSLLGNSRHDENDAMTINEDGSPVLIEYGVYRHRAKYLYPVDSVEEAERAIKSGEEYEEHAGLGVFVDGEPHAYNGRDGIAPPTPEQAEEMRQFYREARAE